MPGDTIGVDFHFSVEAVLLNPIVVMATARPSRSATLATTWSSQWVPCGVVALWTRKPRGAVRPVATWRTVLLGRGSWARACISAVQQEASRGRVNASRSSLLHPHQIWNGNDPLSKYIL